MKKCCILTLCFLLLLLCGCGQQANNTQDNSTPAPVNPTDFMKFCWQATDKESAAIDYTFQLDGVTKSISLKYENNNFIVTDSNGSRSYKHLICSPQLAPDGADYSYTDYVLLSDDPEMTSERYHRGETAKAELIYADHIVHTGAALYGEVPNLIKAHITDNYPFHWYIYNKSSYFRKEWDSPAVYTPTQAIERYSYEGKLLCRVTAPYSMHFFAGNILELEDGGFLLKCFSINPEEYTMLICFNADGSVRWQKDFRAEYSFSQCFQRAGNIYAIGSKHYQENDTQDIYIGCFSTEGTLLKETTFQGSKSEYLEEIAESSTGFTLWGETHSQDGDFPYSYGTINNPGYFKAEISEDLQIIKKQQIQYDGIPVSGIDAGYHNGVLINRSNPLMAAKSTDQLPKLAMNGSFFDWDGGYVVVRSYHPERSSVATPGDVGLSYCMQVIFTGYNQNGDPLWQCTSDLFLPDTASFVI